MIAWKERMKDGRHVGLDFYDLLIEPILPNNAIERTHMNALVSTKNDRMAQAETARTGQRLIADYTKSLQPRT